MYDQKGISIVGILKVTIERAESGSGFVRQRYGSEDLHPYPYQNATDPEHCC